MRSSTLKLYIVIAGTTRYTMFAQSIWHASMFVRHWPRVRIMRIQYVMAGGENLFI